MASTTEHHPSHLQLVAFGQGRLSVIEAEQVEGHLQSCRLCCDVMSSVTCDDELAVLARAVHANRLADKETGQPSLAATKIDFDNRSAGPGESGNPSCSEPDEIPFELRQHPRYRVMQVLGRGGMGVVWLAEHQMMRRLVALKVIGSQFTAGRAAVDRFQQEIRAAAKLQHPNIVTAFDAEQAGELHFLVMEYVDGLSLSEHVRQHGPLSIEMIQNVIRQVCAGLSHAHRQGLVHRDIKPQNLMLGNDGTIRILDFGLARLTMSDGPVSQTAKTEVRLTAVGMVLGTPDYMSPEQAADAGTVDARSDIYSLGGTLFFLLTGRAPFEGCSFEQMLISGLRNRVAAMRELRPDVPASMVSLIERMTAENPADRIQSADGVISELDAGQRASDAKAQSLQDIADQAHEPVPATRVKDEIQIRTRAHGARQTGSAKRRAAPRPAPGAAPETPKRNKLAQLDRFRPKRRSWTMFAVCVGATIIVGGLIVATSGMLQPLTSLSSETSAEAEPGSSSSDARSNSTVASGASGGQTAPDSRPQLPSGDPERPGAERQLAATGQRFRVLFIVPAKDFYWPDVGPVSRILTESGCEMVMASWQTPATVVNDSDLPVRIRHLLMDIDPSRFDALIIGGGPGIVRLTESCPEAEDAERITRQMLTAGKLITAFNAGPGVLAKMKLLDGINATGNPQLQQRILDTWGVSLTSNEIEVSGNIITASDNRLEVISRFCSEIINKLREKKGNQP